MGALATVEDSKTGIRAKYYYDTVGRKTGVNENGTWTYTWQQGRKLATMSSGSTTWTYTYDANGMRTKRTNGSTTYNYTYHGSQLTHMTYGSIALHFYYDASGRPLSVTYGGATYYYVLNLQGDVVAILNSSGAQVVGYTYDAWGRPLTVTGSMASTLGQYNPLRYRGYVYDGETGLYYLQSRYYNPTIGRFMNADIQLSTGDFTESNLFAYCGNNPVRRIDFTGTSWISDAWERICGAAKDIWNYITNDDEETVRRNLKKNGVSFYKGTFVFSTPLLERSAFSFIIIGMGDYYLESKNFNDTLNHEYGHTKHMRQTGITAYLPLPFHP